MVIRFLRFLVCLSIKLSRLIWHKYFAVLHYNQVIIDVLLNEVSVNVHQINAFNQTPLQVAKSNDSFPLFVSAIEESGRLLLNQQNIFLFSHCITGRKPYECKLCLKLYTKPTPLKYHTQKAHPVDGIVKSKKTQNNKKSWQMSIMWWTI